MIPPRAANYRPQKIPALREKSHGRLVPEHRRKTGFNPAAGRPAQTAGNRLFNVRSEPEDLIGRFVLSESFFIPGFGTGLGGGRPGGGIAILRTLLLRFGSISAAVRRRPGSRIAQRRAGKQACVSATRLSDLALVEYQAGKHHEAGASV